MSTLEGTAVSNFIYFYTFHGLKQVAETHGEGRWNTLQDLVFATIAGWARAETERGSSNVLQI
jgi:hypothetical protein